jgi:hypothetical protein
MMCGGGGGGSVSAKTEEFYKAGKKDYGDLPSLAMGDKVERTKDGMADIPDPSRNKRKKANKKRLKNEMQKESDRQSYKSGMDRHRSLLKPY